MLDTIRISQEAKDQLSWLKRKTGIPNWNILCRWAFCLSLKEPSIPPQLQFPLDSNVEMTWKVFAGDYHEIFLALLRQRCKEDKLEVNDGVLADQFKLHLHRGIGYMFADKSINRINDLLEGVTNAR